jgi:hypothetical protein
MFGSKTFGRLLLAILVLLVGWLIVHQSEAKGAITPCKLGNLCIVHSTTKNNTGRGEYITFTVKLRNNLNFTSTDMQLRYTTPRQVLVRGINPAPNKGRTNVTIWRIPRLDPGDTWTAKVRVEVLSYATKTIANKVEVFFKGQRWLSSWLTYGINNLPR